MSEASAALNRPLWGATFGQAVSRFFRKYATFSGRASRSEYWWVALFVFLITLVPNALLVAGVTIGVQSALELREPVSMGTNVDDSTLIGYSQPGIFADPTAMLLITLGSVIGGIIVLAIIVPSLALTWRRLHDASLGGPWFFLTLIPGVGGFFLLALMVQPAKKEGRRFDVPLA